MIVPPKPSSRVSSTTGTPSRDAGEPIVSREMAEAHMRRCLELSEGRRTKVAPNPLVGCVIAEGASVVATGVHEVFGGPHAEVNAIRAIPPQQLSPDTILVVNLEPCSHFGKTPPCVDLIIASGIRHVIIGLPDPFPLVRGNGIKRLQQAGISVLSGVLPDECWELNKRFYTTHLHNRPYIILKWAQSADGFIAPLQKDAPRRISNLASHHMVHRWRAEEDAILVGTTTAAVDNPQLNVRYCTATHQPLRIVLDRHLSLPKSLHLFDGTSPTLVVHAPGAPQPRETHEEVSYLEVPWDSNKEVLHRLLQHLAATNIQSLIVEGGTFTLTEFLAADLWDEIRLFTAPVNLRAGVPAPSLPVTLQIPESHAATCLVAEHSVEGDRLTVFKRRDQMTLF